MLQHSLADLGIVQSIRYIITFSRCTVVVRHFQIEHQFLLDLLFPVVDPIVVITSNCSINTLSMLNRFLFTGRIPKPMKNRTIRSIAI